jgi:hypothetical protein
MIIPNKQASGIAWSLVFYFEVLFNLAFPKKHQPDPE